MKKLYLAAMCLSAAAVNANAESYFFSENGAGDNDGTSWENAAPSEYLPSTVANAEPGDCFYLMGGTYLNMQDIVWTIPQGISIIGGFPASSTGTDTNITYPTGTETVFTADIDGDGIGDNGTNAFITIENTNPSPDKSNFAKVLLAGITIRDAVEGGGKYKGSAMYTNNANIELDHVKIINNKISSNGGVCVFVGTSLYAHDCVWSDNHGISTGIAFLARQKGSGTSAGVDGCDLILERCEIVDNTVAEPNNSNVARYGGAFAVADYGGTLYMINCTVTGSHISWAGATTRMGGGTVLYSIFNSWYDCTCSYDVRHSGDLLSAGTGSEVYTAATIAVTPTDGRDGMMASNYIQGGTGAVFEPFGYNVWGSLNDATASAIPATNNISKTNVTATVFGTNVLSDNGGFSRTIEPLASFCNVPLSEIEGLAAKWNLPSVIDLTVDQRGCKRGATTYVGAYDPNGETGGVETVAADSKAVPVVGLGNGQFRVTAGGHVRVFDTTGRLVSDKETEANGVIDLAPYAKGIYIIAVDGSVQKVTNN